MCYAIPRRAIGADGIAIVLKDGEHCFYVAEDSISPLWHGQRFAADDCISGWAMRHRETVSINDVRGDPRVPQEAYAPTFVRSLVMAPIGTPEPVAALGAYCSEAIEHDQATIERVESLARLATIAIENVDLALARDRAAALGTPQARILELAVVEAPLHVKRATTLVQRLLAFARRQPLQTVAVDLAELVHNKGELVESTTGPQIKVVIEAGDLPLADADPNQLEMALLNLAVNARDAMPNGGTLPISAFSALVQAGHRSRLQPGRYLCLSTADSGIGMNDVTLARAVEPFFSTKGVGKGTGLGLSMVHGLASQLGGALTVSSRVGIGTNVELWLPVSTRARRDDQQRSVAAAETRDRGRALLVDDEELVRLSTADMLSGLGYGVVEAASAEQAVALLGSDESFDVVVTDHLMAGMTGEDLARYVRTHHPGVAVLLASGYAELEGVDQHLHRLTKPFRRDQLAGALAKAVPN